MIADKDSIRIIVASGSLERTRKVMLLKYLSNKPLYLLYFLLPETSLLLPDLIPTYSRSLPKLEE